MPTEKGIKAKYKEMHRILTHRYYFGKRDLTKLEFDFLHGKLWENMAQELREAGFLPEGEERLTLEDLEKRVAELERG